MFRRAAVRCCIASWGTQKRAFFVVEASCPAHGHQSSYTHHIGKAKVKDEEMSRVPPSLVKPLLLVDEAGGVTSVGGGERAVDKRAVVEPSARSGVVPGGLGGVVGPGRAGAAFWLCESCRSGWGGKWAIQSVRERIFVLSGFL